MTLWAFPSKDMKARVLIYFLFNYQVEPTFTTDRSNFI